MTIDEDMKYKSEVQGYKLFDPDMNIYTIYAELAEGVKPHISLDSITEYLTPPQLHAFRITRMKLGFSCSNLGEWRIDMEFKTMQDLDDAMDFVICKRYYASTLVLLN